MTDQPSKNSPQMMHDTHSASDYLSSRAEECFEQLHEDNPLLAVSLVNLHIELAKYIASINESPQRRRSIRNIGTSLSAITGKPSLIGDLLERTVELRPELEGSIA